MTDAAPELAVLIVNYRTGEHLARCLDSLAARAGAVSVETIVVDNASGDGSGGTRKKGAKAEKDDRVTISFKGTINGAPFFRSTPAFAYTQKFADIPGYTRLHSVFRADICPRATPGRG